MSLHPSTFEYLVPTDKQLLLMADVRSDFAAFVALLDERLPDGPDKTYIMRKLRAIAMWANVTVTRNADGSPREDKA